MKKSIYLFMSICYCKLVLEVPSQGVWIIVGGNVQQQKRRGENVSALFDAVREYLRRGRYDAAAAGHPQRGYDAGKH